MRARQFTTFLIILVIINPPLQAKAKESAKKKFLSATEGEIWRINDEVTLVLDEPEFFSGGDIKLKRQLFFLHNYLTWHTIFHLIDTISQWKIVFIIKSDGWKGRWKYIKYGKYKDGEIKIYYGWILATRVEDAEFIKKK